MTSLPTSFVEDMERANGAEPLDGLLGRARWGSQKRSGRMVPRSMVLAGYSTISGSPICPWSHFASEMNLRESGGKVTDDLVDQKSHADKEYVKFLNDHIVRRAKWLALDAHRDSIVMRVNRGQAMLKVGARMTA